ncbi:MAG: hypothetical protein KIS66_16760 [Fimbriimonadaceae bacterium]|nr:hypothetical protein [Fimbriimonadaceae bacterium]
MRFNVRPGNLSTTRHKTGIGDDESPSKLNVDTSRGVWEITKRYRKVSTVPIHASGTPTQPGTGFGVGHYDGNERFVICAGDSLFTNPSLTPGDWVDSLGSTDRTSDLAWAATDLFTGNSSVWQDGEYVYVTNEGQTRRIHITTGAVSRLEKCYDSSLYDGLWSVAPNWTKLQWAAGDTLGDPTGGGTSRPVRYKPIDSSNAYVVAANVNFNATDGFTMHDNFQPNPQQIAKWTIQINFSPARDFSAYDYLLIPISRMSPTDEDPDSFIDRLAQRVIRDGVVSAGGAVGAAKIAANPGIAAAAWSFNNNRSGDRSAATVFLGYGTDPDSDTDGVNDAHRGGFQLMVGFDDGTDEVSFVCYFLNPNGSTLYILVPLAWSNWYDTDVNVAAITALTFDVWMRGSDFHSQSIQVPHFYGLGSCLPHNATVGRLTGSLLDNARIVAEETDLLGYGPLTDGEYLDYAYRYKVGTTYSDPVLVRVPKGEAFGEPFEFGGFVIPNKVTITPPYLATGGWTHIELYRKRSSDSTFRLISTVANSGTPSYTDEARDDELTGTALGSDVPAPYVADVVAGCSHNGGNVYFGGDGKAYFSEVGFPLNVLWPDFEDFPYTEDDLGRPRTVPISDSKNPALCGVSNGALYVFCRREAFAKGGKYPSDGFVTKIASRGALSQYAACAVEGRVVFASDAGLFSLYVNPYFETLVGSAPEPEELTLNLRDTWTWLIGDLDAREKTVVRYHDRELWVFCEERWLHLTRHGHWNTGEWADDASVVCALADPISGFLLQFEDGSFGTIGSYPTDGGTNEAGDNGTTVTWTYWTKRWLLDASVNRVSADVEASSGVPAVTTTLYTSRSQNGQTVTFTGVEDTSQAFASGEPTNGQWHELKLTGRAQDTLLALETDRVPAHEDRGPKYR